MTTYALATLHLPATIAFGVTVLNGGLSMVSEVSAGWLSDRFGRKPVMIIPGVLLVLCIFPCFWAINHFHTASALYGAESIMVILGAASSVPAFATVVESLPRAIRSGALAVIYAFAISIFGGWTQFVITLLIRLTGDPLSPAYYWTAAASIGLIAMLLVRESAPVRRKTPP
jgi:MFS family permease